MYSVQPHYHGAKCAASGEKAQNMGVGADGISLALSMLTRRRFKVNRRRRDDGAGF